MNVPMNILNRTIVKKFIRPFISSFAILCILIVVSQVFEQLDRFLGKGLDWRHIAGYIAASLPFQSLQMLPVACLLGTLFVVGDFSRNREYIASLAGGLAPEKFLGGLLVAGLFISFLAVLANETFIPNANRYSRQVYREQIRRLGGGIQTMFYDLYVAGHDGRLWQTRAFDSAHGRMSRVLVDTLNEGRLGQQIDASSTQWSEDDGWTFFNGVVRTFDKNGFSVEVSEAFEKKTFKFSEVPSDLVTNEPQPEEMNYKRLKRHIKRLSMLGIDTRRLQVELMVKTAFPMSCLIVIALGIPLALSGKGSKAIGIAASGILTLMYLGCMQMGKALALRIIPPFLGAWLGNLLFLSIAIFLWLRMRRNA